MPQQTDTAPHELTLRNRKQLTMTGATQIMRFDDTAVVLETALGTLIISGSSLNLKTLSLEGGRVEVEGDISALSYAETPTATGWLHRLFG